MAAKGKTKKPAEETGGGTMEMVNKQEAGGRIVKPAQDVFWGGHSGYFADLDGYYWEVAWGPMFSFNAAGELVV